MALMRLLKNSAPDMAQTLFQTDVATGHLDPSQDNMIGRIYP